MNQESQEKNQEAFPDADLLAHLMGEGDAGQRRRVERALESSPGMRRSAAQMRDLLQDLRALPPEKTRRDLAAAVWAETGESSGRDLLPFVPPPLLRAAAGLVLLLGLAGFLFLARPTAREGARAEARSSEAVGRAQSWLVDVQRADGSWGPGPDTLRRDYAEALTAIAMLAILEDGVSAADGGARAEAVRRGVQFVTRGRIAAGAGRRPAARVGGLSLFALLEAHRRGLAPGADPAIHRGIEALARAGRPRGTWGYEAPGSGGVPAGDAWRDLALQAAALQGWESAREAVRQGLVAPADAATVADAKRRLWVGQAEQLTHHGPAASPGATPPRLAAELLQQQEREGSLAGSWLMPGTASWPGSRIYSTALGTLGLKALAGDGSG